jgi:hypothetical protein
MPMRVPVLTERRFRAERFATSTVERGAMRYPSVEKTLIVVLLAAFGSFGSHASVPFAAATPPAMLPGGPPAHNQSPPPPTPKPAGTPHPFSLSIVSIDPAAPVAGERVTINYVVRNLAPGAVPAHLSATIAGGLPQTASVPPVDTVFLGNQQATGSLVISGGPVGSDPIELTLSTTPCGATASANPACAATIFARASTTVTVAAAPVAPTVRMRIAGTSYADIHKGDSSDGGTIDSGYYFIVHEPGCSSNFASGKNGDDTFFKKKDLPAGATLKAVDFTMYRVSPTIKAQYYGGGVGGYGSYGLKLEHDSGNALHVHWENACRGPYETLPVVYSISFEIDTPKGMNLGEDATVATAQPYPPTSMNYTSLGVVGAGTNAAAATIPEPVQDLLKWNGEAFSDAFAPKAAGTVSALYNGDPFPIVLIADKRLGAGCGSDGNVVLQGHQSTTADQFAALYGAASVHTPKTFTACSLQSPPNTQQGIFVTLTFLAD